MANSLRDSKVDLLTTQNPDMKQRRVVNAAPALEANDYVIKKQLDDAISFNSVGRVVSSVLDKLQSISLRVIATAINAADGLVITKSDKKTALLTFDSLTPQVIAAVVLSAVNGLKAAKIYPSANSTTAIQFTRADGSTAVLTIDTSNSTPIIDINGRIRTVSATSASPATGTGLEIAFPAASATGIITSVNRSAGTFQPLQLNSSSLILNSTTLSFFGAAAAAQQTLTAYTTSNRSATFTSTPGALGTAATLADLNTLRASYEVLRLAYDDLRTKLQTTTLVG